MPCMCGDICCPSCGPAQGNHKCEKCGAWASEGCEHYPLKEDPQTTVADDFTVWTETELRELCEDNGVPQREKLDKPL
jgi:hypothetical protein